MKLYSIKDTVIGRFEQPFAAENDKVATREFEQAANNPNSRVCVFAKDMDLYCLGEWDTKTGVIKGETEFIANALTFRKEV